MKENQRLIDWLTEISAVFLLITTLLIISDLVVKMFAKSKLVKEEHAKYLFWFRDIIVSIGLVGTFLYAAFSY